MNADTEPVTGEIVPYGAPPSSAVPEEYRPRILMDAADAKELDDKLRAAMRAVLREGTDYGIIPGAGDRKNLLKPGAEKLLQWFGFGSRSAEVKIERDDPDHPSEIADRARRIGVTYRTVVTKTVPGTGEVIVATCEGYAGYDEDRYYSSAEQAEAKERANAQRYKRQPNLSKFAEYRAPWNTLIKMAQKRAYVGAAIDATGAAGLFTQDMEDMPGAPSAAPAELAEKGRAEIGALPQAVGRELDAWYKAVNWPEPETWNTEQWCKALVKAGKLSAGQAAQEAPQQAQEASPAGPAPRAQPEAAQRPEGQQKRPESLPRSVDREAQALADEADKATTPEALAAIRERAQKAGKLAKAVQEPGGTVVGPLQAFLNYCENSMKQAAESAA